MVSCWVLLKKPLPVEAAISKNGCKPHLCQCAIPHLCQSATPHNTLPNKEHTTPYHTCSWFYQGIHICHATHYHTNQQKYLQTTPIQHQARLRSLYIIKGFRNYQPIVTTISHDTLAYLEFTAIILVQYTQSKHRVAEGAISHRFRLRLVVAV